MADPQEFKDSLVEEAHAKDFLSAVLYRRLPPDHPIHNLVGRVAAGWAIVEHMQDAIIWSLLKTGDRAGACVTAQMIGSRNRSLTIIALCEQFSLPKEVLDLAVKVSSHLYEPQKRRNRILHDPWYVDDAVSGTHQFRAMPPEDYSFSLVPSDVGYLNETLAIIDRRIDEIGRLSQKINAARP
jgi:hypothetical protein